MSDTARLFLKALFEVYLEGDGQGLPFIGPRPVLHLTNAFFDNPANQSFLDLVCRAAAERGGVVLAFDRPNGNEATSAFTPRYGVSADKLQRATESWQWRAAIDDERIINPGSSKRCFDKPPAVFPGCHVEASALNSYF